MAQGLTVPAKHRPKLRVLVVDDSIICRESIKAILQADGDIEVVGEGEDGFEALPLVETLAPDLVTMDVQMPGKNGLEAVEQIMARRPVPILVVTSEPLDDAAGVAFTAIENGALDIVAKPAVTDDGAGEQLRTLVRTLAKTPVFQRAMPERSSTVRAPPSSVAEWATIIAGSGGMPSVLGVLSRLSPLRCPLVVHQPVAPEMIRAYAKHLARLAKQPVVVAEPGEIACHPGTIVLVLGKRAQCTQKGMLAVTTEPSSASLLLESVSGVYGRNALAVVLAGHGTDGVDALAKLRGRDAPVIVESPLSASVPELPAAAVQADVADAILPMHEIAERLVQMASLV